MISLHAADCQGLLSEGPVAEIVLFVRPAFQGAFKVGGIFEEIQRDVRRSLRCFVFMCSQILKRSWGVFKGIEDGSQGFQQCLLVLMVSRGL